MMEFVSKTFNEKLHILGKEDLYRLIFSVKDINYIFKKKHKLYMPSMYEKFISKI